MLNQFSRTALLLGDEGIKKLAAARVAVFGLGGVGGHACDALARSGVGALDLIDNDTVSVTNINRQLFAALSSVGRYKVDIAAEHIADINPDAMIRTYKTFYLPETASQFNFGSYDYIIDAIDTVTGKLTLIEKADRAGVPVISSMGAGNKLDPTAFEVSDIYKTSVCPLAKVMRRELKQRGIKKLKVVYSKEIPVVPRQSCEEESSKQQIPGSCAFVPSVAGLIIAGEVIKDLIK